MQKVIPRIGVRFDVVQQHPWGPLQLGQGWVGVQSLRRPGGLHLRLGHQFGGNGGVLPGVLRIGQLKLGRQRGGVGGRQFGQGANALAHQQLPAFAADAADLAQVAFGGGDLIADPAPAAKRAFLAVADQTRRLGPLQIGGQTLEALVELALQAAAQGQALLLQLAAPARDHQPMADAGLLQRGQQPAPQRQLQAMLAGDPIPLPCQHRPVAPVTPAAAAVGALQQRRVGLNREAGRSHPLEPQSHHGFGAGLRRLKAMTRSALDQGLKALDLLLQRQGTVRVPLSLLGRAVLIEPGPAPAAHPAAQQAIGEQHRGHRHRAAGPARTTSLT